MDFTIKKHGPVFDGRAARTAHELVRFLRRTVAEVGEHDVERTASQFQNPTGNWQRHVHSSTRGLYDVIDDPVVYNAWLEGTGSRNRTSRFKGYAMWRRSTQALRRKVPAIARGAIGPFLRRMQ
jgi:hypothetical protein